MTGDRDRHERGPLVAELRPGTSLSRRHPFATGHVLAAVAALAIVSAALAAASGSLDPSAPTPIPVRIVALVGAAGALPVLALVAREVGGTRRAQALAAWGMAGVGAASAFGNVPVAAGIDLVVWPAVILFAMRAVLRDDGRWWLAAGAAIGAGTANEPLIAVLVLGIGLGVALGGPRRWFSSGWLWGAGALAIVLAATVLAARALEGWSSVSPDARTTAWPMLVPLVGPVLAAFAVIALVTMFRDRAWRPVRFVAVASGVVVASILAAGAPPSTTAGMLAVLVALGAVPVAQWADTRARRMLLITGLAANAAVCTFLTIAVVATVGAHAPL